MLNTQIILRNCYVANRPIEPQKKLTNPEDIKINFNDGTSTVYRMTDLMKLGGIKAILNSTSEGELQPSSKEFREREITLQESSPEMFHVAKTLILEQEPFYEVFSEESFDNPFLFEEISELLLYFHLDDGKALIDHLKKDQLPLMTYEIAKRTLKGFEALALSNPERLKGDNGEAIPVPATVVVAKKIIFLAKCLPENEISEYFDKLRECKQEIIACENISQNLREQLPKVKHEVDKILINAQLLNMKNAIGECEQTVKQLSRKTNIADLTDLTMMSRQIVSQRMNDEDPEIVALAQASKIQLEEYKAMIIKGLELAKADMTRTDLLEYVIGPKAYLFDEYGFERKLNDDLRMFPNSAFIHPNTQRVRFVYHLHNENGRKLEGEIREDLHDHAPDYVMFEHVIKDKAITKPITPAVAKLRETLIPVFKAWSTTTDEEKKAVVTALIEHNGWDKSYEIKPEDLTFSIGEFTETMVIKGTLIKFANKFPVHFRLTDFVLLIPKNARHKHPDATTTMKVLNDAKGNRFYQYEERRGGLLYF